MPEVRQRFSEELRALEDEAQQTAARAQLLLEQALQALLGDHLEICDQVVRGDDEVDALYLDVERRILHLFALQTPVAIDLRLLTALLHINLHLERVGDQAVNIAKIAKLAYGLPQIPGVLQDLEEMGATALRMVGTAMDALAQRDVDLAQTLPELDDPIDQLNREMLPKCSRWLTTSACWSGGSACMSCRARSSESATTRWTSAGRSLFWSPGSSTSSPMPHTQRSNTQSY
jgi:phosphate transport system protein